jgi:hypothetical protein
MPLLLFFSFFHTLLLLFRNEIEKMLSLFLCNQHALCAPLNVLRRYQPPFAAWKDPTPHRLALTAVFTAALRDSALDKSDYPFNHIYNLPPFELCVISPSNTRMGQQCVSWCFSSSWLEYLPHFLAFCVWQRPPLRDHPPLHSRCGFHGAVAAVLVDRQRLRSGVWGGACVVCQGFL